MKMTEVKSSNVQAVGYDAATQTLRVRFKGAGVTWEYEDVPVAVYHQLVAAKSVGRTFAELVKGKFKAARISSEQDGGTGDDWTDEDYRSLAAIALDLDDEPR
jgi:hypothetical protein